jgi:hypothetical protein
MRLPTTIRSLLLTVIFLFVTVAAPAQDGSGGDAQQAARRKYDSISFAKGDFQISDPALVPQQLALAAEQLRCDYKTDIKQLPVHFISAEDRRLALVFCRSGVSGSHHVFDFGDLRRPQLVQLPFIAQKEGFGTTLRPGLMTWKRDAGVFEAVSGSDMSPNSELRHTYRLGSTEGWVSRVASFVVVRVEVRDKYCGRNISEWAIVWEAPPWPKSVVVR